MAQARKTIVPTAQIWFDAARDHPKHPHAVIHMENAFNHTENALAAMSKALDAMQQECWSVKCESYATGGDDYDVGCEVISHWQAKPHERVEGRGKTPLEALNDAIDKGEAKRIAAANSR